MSGGKKHKRGARGSTEEDTNISKRANMAATEDMQDQEQTTEKPAITATETSLEDLKEMLVDIQINISNIFLEFNGLLGNVTSSSTFKDYQEKTIPMNLTSFGKF